MLFVEVARTWADVASTRSRLAKVARLAETLAALDDEERAAGTAMLTGAPRQGRMGVGWASLRDLEVAPAGEPTLSVADVDDAFATLATTSGPGSVARRSRVLEDLWGRATTDEQSLLRGLVLQEVRQGALEGVVLAAVARAAAVDEPVVRRAAMLSGDLTAAAVVAMEDGAEALAAIGLEVGRPVLPMLASSEPDLAAALARTGPARVDTKFDGMRIQVHRTGDDVAVFTRSLRDVTGDLPRVVEAARGLAADTVVLDGEALALDDDGRPRAFQDTMSGDTHLRPVFFDLLHLDGTDLLDEPLTTRREALARVAPDHLADGVETDDPEVGTDHLRAALAAGHEGVVVKSLDAPWEAGRRGASWVKVKVAHTLDLVVLAAEWGSGRRRGWLSNLHLGAVDDDTGEVVMLGKTFKGLTDELLAWQTEAFLARETSRSDHVVHVRPELVVEIAFDGVQSSSRYPGGVTLRFARVKRYRDDKRVEDADTLQTVRDIHRGVITPEV
ncbi:ATP-dependent DNA ligase [Salsipaludibacter albus]|uniref:ATP-dependent DNA ligase n=1 Tax=Salsipaludibacter albus TaxID=2849650 RepID=UPI001EE4E9A2|nr:ATP-dependent DNA ligase [Salsipaludibacter albus]MBY5162779.1 ATP-dependent DNA ligase [Salsipaludibacter albus]